MNKPRTDAKSFTIDLTATDSSVQTLTAEEMVVVGTEQRGTYNILVSNYNVNNEQYNYDTRVEIWVYEFEAATNLMLKAQTITNPPTDQTNSFTKWASALGPNDNILIRVSMNNTQQQQDGEYVTHKIHVAYW